MTAVSVKNLSVRFGDHIVLDHLTFDIPEKSICAIIGPNGCGKTTLLKAILGLIPHTGETTIFNKRPKDARNELAYVPQRFTFDKTFPITIKEFLALEQRPHVNVQENINAKLIEVGMSTSHKKLLGHLSGGQLQRILIAKALLNDPKILFLDEPAAGIDIKGERNFYELIKHLNEKHHVTVIIVSHEVDIVHKYASQVICLNKQMLCFGKPMEVLTEQTLKNLYDENISIYQHKVHKHD